MKKEEGFDGIDMNSLEDAGKDTLGLDVYLMSADDIQDADFYGSMEVWDEKEDSKKEVVCPSIAADIEKIMRAARYYMVRHYEVELKLKLRNDSDGALTKQSRKFSQISKILMQISWLEINDRYDCWETDTTAIRIKDGKLVVISYSDDSMDNFIEKFKDHMQNSGGGGFGGGGSSGGFFGGTLQDFKRFMDGLNG